MSSPMETGSKIYVAGHRGLVGSALLRQLKAEGYADIITPVHAELDLADQQAVRAFFERERPDYVFLAAAKVGGIVANSTYPADFIHHNLAIQTNVIHESRRVGVKRLLFLGSSCIYPRDCPQPIKEEFLLTGPLEPTNRPYAVAKIAGIEMCWAYNRQFGTRYLAVMPTNLYGPGDNYDLEKSHVMPALIRKFHLAKLATQKDWHAIEREEAVYGPIPADIRAALAASPPQVRLWGTGTPRREFLYSDDLASACVFLMNRPDTEISSFFTDRFPPLFNIGCGRDQSIRELAEQVANAVGFHGDVVFDAEKPDGMPQKRLDVSRLERLGWQQQTPLETGIHRAYLDYLSRL